MLAVVEANGVSARSASRLALAATASELFELAFQQQTTLLEGFLQLFAGVGLDPEQASSAQLHMQWWQAMRWFAFKHPGSICFRLSVIVTHV